MRKKKDKAVAFDPQHIFIRNNYKIVRPCNRVINLTTSNKAFTKDQELTIGLKTIKEFVIKIKSGAKMKKGKFAYFNGIVNKLMDKFYFDKEFMGDVIFTVVA